MNVHWIWVFKTWVPAIMKLIGFSVLKNWINETEPFIYLITQYLAGEQMILLFIVKKITFAAHELVKRKFLKLIYFNLKPASAN